jgi:hypothetical protein
MITGHRIRQGVRALLAFSLQVDDAAAAQILSPQQMALFKRMSRSEQYHSLNVLQSAQKRGDVPHDLAVAALLHDAGKIRYPLAVWQKTLAVLVRGLFPRQFFRWSEGCAAHFLIRPFAVAMQHPVWSAQLLAEAGASERVLWLVEHHQDEVDRWRDHPYYDLLKWLQAADDEN